MIRAVLSLLLAACAHHGVPQPPADQLPGAALAACLAPEIGFALGLEVALPLAVGLDAGTVCVDARSCVLAHGAPPVEALAEGEPLRRQIDRALAVEDALARIPAATDCGEVWRDALVPTLASLATGIVEALADPLAGPVCATWVRPVCRSEVTP